METQEYHKIGQVARELGISVELIRVYENEGLVIPVRTEKGQRKYSENDIRWITCIRRLINEQGLNIEGIRRMLALMPCWECGPCTEDEKQICPAFLGTTKPCWMIKEQLPKSCRDENCRECKVYQSALQCENLKKVLFHPENYLHNNK
ncbi:MAG: MerR family transcriptional regulator [bacterium]|nr:MerR family transcriptional regulator [bacterium]